MDERYFRAALEHRYALYPEIPVIAEFDGYRDRDVLEVGVGQGSDHFMFASGGARLAGIDLTPRHCEITRLLFATLGASTRLYRADARSLPFAAESFDHVYSCGVLLLVREMDRALSEIHRVLRPGGSTTIMLYNRSSVHYWLKTRLYYGWALGENTVLGRDTVLDWYTDGIGYPDMALRSPDLRSSSRVRACRIPTSADTETIPKLGCRGRAGRSGSSEPWILSQERHDVSAHLPAPHSADLPAIVREQVAFGSRPVDDETPAERRRRKVDRPLAGWHGHAAPNRRWAPSGPGRGGRPGVK